MMRQGLHIIVAVVALVCSTPTMHAQLRVIPEHQLDSLRKIDSQQSRSMHFEEQTIDLGTVAESAETIKLSAKWQNKGTQTVVITKITSTCSCLQCKGSRQPIAADESSSIEITFKPRGRNGHFSKRLYVYTNLNAAAPTSTLTIKGRVEGYKIK